MSELLKSTRVKAVGEVGLDHSVNEKEWAYQMELMRKVLPLVSGKVLVLHCRGIRGDNGMEVHLLLLHLLKGLPKEQKIHLHAFMGTPLVMEWWLKAFPQTHFSYNRSLAHFSQEQIQAVREMDQQKILLETDAPYFPSKGRKFSVPLELYDVAELVANLRNTTPASILEVTTRNALRLYQ